MSAALSREGVLLTRVFCCPHLEHDQCACRKPRPGLIHRAMNESPFLIDLAASVMIGDSASDMLAGRTAGVGRLIFVGDRHASLPDGTIVAGSVRDVLTLIPRALAALGS